MAVATEMKIWVNSTLLLSASHNHVGGKARACHMPLVTLKLVIRSSYLVRNVKTGEARNQLYRFRSDIF